MPRLLRSILAIIAGYIVMAVVVMVCTVICIKAFHLLSGHPTPTYLAINIVYSLTAAGLGGWVAARIAGYKPRTHGFILAALMFVFGALSLLHLAPNQPFAYQVFLAIGPPFAAVLGSMLVKE